MPQYNVSIARFPFKGVEHPDVADWLVRTAVAMKRDSRIAELRYFRLDDTPITMTRNKAVRLAQQVGADYLLMVDSDMAPDLDLPGAKAFWPTSWEFMVENRGTRPAMIAAPYVGPPPNNNVYIFQWANWMNGDVPKPDFRLDQYTREQAETMAGIGLVHALPTGLILIDMRCFKRMQPPWFYYEWKDEYEDQKASTEDVTFTRDATFSGCRCFCNWDAWAGHWKNYRCDKPVRLTADGVRNGFVEAIRRELKDELWQEVMAELDKADNERRLVRQNGKLEILPAPLSQLTPNDLARTLKLEESPLEALRRKSSIVGEATVHDACPPAPHPFGHTLARTDGPAPETCGCPAAPPQHEIDALEREMHGLMS